MNNEFEKSERELWWPAQETIPEVAQGDRGK